MKQFNLLLLLSRKIWVTFFLFHPRFFSPLPFLTLSRWQNFFVSFFLGGKFLTICIIFRATLHSFSKQNHQHDPHQLLKKIVNFNWVRISFLFLFLRLDTRIRQRMTSEIYVISSSFTFYYSSFLLL